MRRFAKWHIWLGWLAGVPLLMWTLSGLVMVAKPIEEVRGNHLRIDMEEAALPANAEVVPPPGPRAGPVKSMTVGMDGGQPVTRIDYIDGSFERFAANGSPVAPLSGDDARALVAERIIGGGEVVGATLFEADDVPIDFRRPLAVWQVRLADRSYIYVGRDTGRIEAVRTHWWRVFDTMWGLHIMDLEARQDTSHPILIGFTALAMLTVLIGIILLFRRRRPRLASRSNA